MIFLTVGVSHEYKMSGKIESIAYTNSMSGSPKCYIAINDNSSSRGFYFHEVRKEQMCLFAERCFELGYTVKVIGDAEMLGANKITTIEHDSSATKWWTIT